MVLKTVNIAADIPMPSARRAKTAIVKPGVRRSERRAWRTSKMMVSMRRRLSSRQGDPCKRSAHSGAVVIHVPLPRVLRAIVDERCVKARGRSVVEEEGNRITGDEPVAG